MDRGLSDIDVLIREEKRLTAVESYEDAWAEGRAAGIEPDIMAEAAIATASRSEEATSPSIVSQLAASPAAAVACSN